MKDEGIKAVEMTRGIRDRMYDETKDMGQEEFLRYVKRRSAVATKKFEKGEASAAKDVPGSVLR